MSFEILPVPFDKKLSVVEHIRSHLIPGMSQRNIPAEKELQILHRAGTWYAKPADIEYDYRCLSYIAFYAGLNSVPLYKDDLYTKVIEELGDKPERYLPYCHYPKGNYRVLGLFAPNPTLAWYIPDAGKYFSGAMPVSTKDYHHPESPLYHPPVVNIDRYMSQLGQNFNQQFTEARNTQEIAEAIAKFYFWGLAMIHPFLGGNHRGFDRFIELSFVKKGIRIEPPLNETVNIPNDDPFNIAIYRERRRFLTEFGLEEEKPIGQGKREQPRWLRYQRLFNHTLNQILGTDVVQTKEISQAMLNWL